MCGEASEGDQRLEVSGNDALCTERWSSFGSGECGGNGDDLPITRDGEGELEFHFDCVIGGEPLRDWGWCVAIEDDDGAPCRPCRLLLA